MPNDPLAKLRKLVAESKLNQNEIASRLGMSRQQFSYLLRRQQNPGLLIVSRVLEAIGKRFRDLEG